MCAEIGFFDCPPEVCRRPKGGPTTRGDDARCSELELVLNRPRPCNREVLAGPGDVPSWGGPATHPGRSRAPPADAWRGCWHDVGERYFEEFMITLLLTGDVPSDDGIPCLPNVARQRGVRVAFLLVARTLLWLTRDQLQASRLTRVCFWGQGPGSGARWRWRRAEGRTFDVRWARREEFHLRPDYLCHHSHMLLGRVEPGRGEAWKHGWGALGRWVARPSLRCM
jgi:hypothetical protein